MSTTNGSDGRGSPKGDVTGQAGTDKLGKDVIRGVTKRHLLEIKRYEKAEGYRFDQAPSDRFVESMSEGRVHPVNCAFVHRGLEVRCFMPVGPEKPDSTQGLVADMTFQMFFGLPQMIRVSPRRWIVVPALHIPSNIPELKPSKCFEIVRFIGKQDLAMLKAAGASGISDEFLAVMRDGGEAYVSHASIFGNTVCCLFHIFGRAATNEDGTSRVASCVIPIERFFALPSEKGYWHYRDEY